MPGIMFNASNVEISIWH